VQIVVAPQLPQHMRAEARQHDADGGLYRPREMFRYRMTEQSMSRVCMDGRFSLSGTWNRNFTPL